MYWWIINSCIWWRIIFHVGTTNTKALMSKVKACVICHWKALVKIPAKSIVKHTDYITISSVCVINSSHRAKHPIFSSIIFQKLRRSFDNVDSEGVSRIFKDSSKHLDLKRKKKTIPYCAWKKKDHYFSGSEALLPLFWQTEDRILRHSHNINVIFLSYVWDHNNKNTGRDTKGTNWG